jgi:hypothetical protein
MKTSTWLIVAVAFGLVAGVIVDRALLTRPAANRPSVAVPTGVAPVRREAAEGKNGNAAGEALRRQIADLERSLAYRREQVGELQHAVAWRDEQLALLATSNVIENTSLLPNFGRGLRGGRGRGGEGAPPRAGSAP